MSAQLLKILSILVVGSALLACDSETVIPLGSEDPDADQIVGPISVVIDGPVALALQFGQQQTVQARVLRVLDGRPLAGQSVRWSVDGAAAASQLVLLQGVSDETGRVAAELRAGQSRERFALQVQLPGREYEPGGTARVDVSVDGILTGTLELTVTGTEQAPLTELTARVHSGARECATIFDGALPPLSDHALPAERVASLPSAALRFDGLHEEGIYTVTVEARGRAGAVLARGCGLTPVIEPGVLNRLALPLALERPQLAGSYDMGTSLDLGDALPGPAASAVHEAETFFADPAGVLAERAVAQLGLDPVWGEALAPLLEEYLLDRLPGWVGDSLLMGGDLTALLTQLRVGGNLRIDDVEAEALTGHVEWTDFLWQWRAGSCDSSDSCCGRTVYSGADMGLAPIGSDLNGSWKRRADFAEGLGYDIAFDEHRLDLQYGVLVLFALEQFVVPALSGEDSLECAVEAMMGCGEGGSFACGATNSSENQALCGCARAGQWLSDQVGQPRPITEAACHRAVNNLTGELRQRLRGLVYDGSDATHVRMSLSGQARDEGSDLQGDTFALRGTASLVVDGALYPASAVLQADLERASCAASSDCATGQSCHLRSDVLDDCSASLRCGDVVGDRSGIHGCSADRQCASGLCLASNRCFEACEDGSRCSGDLACRGTEVTLVSGAPISVSACLP